jgi:3-keto-5-aminohexanoate cleavage enzyme
VRFDKSRVANSNAELVERVAELVVSKGRTVASAKDARKLLSL